MFDLKALEAWTCPLLEITLTYSFDGVNILKKTKKKGIKPSAVRERHSDPT